MLRIVGILYVCAVAAGQGIQKPSDWDRAAAARYLDSRADAWLAWAPAKAPGGVCVSCHTGLTYLLARPLLRSTSSAPVPQETKLLESLRFRLAAAPSARQPGTSVESVLSAYLLKNEPAFQRMWSMQIKEGESRGAWPWYSLQLHPWESENSTFWGAALAAAAVKSPERTQPAASVAALGEYLSRNASNQPLHNRLMLLWTGALSVEEAAALRDEVWRKQSPDGGWPVDALGPWAEQAKRPETSGSHAYATAYTAYSLMLSNAPCSDPRLGRALNWLRTHQELPSGAWRSPSMNKIYSPDSMQARFMDDAATGFAVLALAGGRCAAK